MTSYAPKRIYSRVGHGYRIMRRDVCGEGFKEGDNDLPLRGCGRQRGVSVRRCNTSSLSMKMYLVFLSVVALASLQSILYGTPII